MKLPTDLLSTLAERRIGDVTLTQFELLKVMVTNMASLKLEYRRQCMSCSAIFSLTLKTEILSTEILDFLEHSQSINPML